MGNSKFFDPQIIAVTHGFCDLMKIEVILGLLTSDLNAFPFCTRDLVNIRNILGDPTAAEITLRLHRSLRFGFKGDFGIVAFFIG